MRSNCSRTAARSCSVSGNPPGAGDACERQLSRLGFFPSNRAPVGVYHSARIGSVLLQASGKRPERAGKVQRNHREAANASDGYLQAWQEHRCRG